MNKQKEDESSVVQLENVDTYIIRRAELNRQLKSKKSKGCC